MPQQPRSSADDLRGAGRLAVDATLGVMTLVEEMHCAVASGPAVLGRPLRHVVPLFTAPVYTALRATTTLVGAALDAALVQLRPLLGEGAAGPQREAVQAALNGVVGDYLSEAHNPLAIEMALLGADGPLEGAGLDARRVVVLVHGSSMAPCQWTRRGHDHGDALAGDLGHAVARLRYNSGLHVSANGRAFAALLERHLAGSGEIVLLGHSMGGLVARSACHYAELAGHLWRSKLRALICLGSPHHGAPLERAGSWAHGLLGISRYSAPFARLARARSAGLTDMRFGNVVDEHWKSRDRFEIGGDRRTPVPLPAGVDCYAIAASRSPGPAARLRGDGVVPVASALGAHERAELTLDFRATCVGYEMGHFDLLDRPLVYETIRRWIGSSRGGAPG